MKKIILTLLTLISFFKISANDIEILRFITKSDTLSIYRNEILWMTKKNFKLTTKVSKQLKQIKPLDTSLHIFHLNDNLEWERVFIHIIGRGGTAIYFPKCELYVRDVESFQDTITGKPVTNRESGVFDEINDIYTYEGKKLFETAKKFNIPTENPAIKSVFLQQKILLNEIEIINKSLLNSLRKYVISDSVVINNNHKFILQIDIFPSISDEEFRIRVTMYPLSVRLREYLYTEIDEFPFCFNKNIPSSWYKSMGHKKDISFKEYYLLNMDNWKITDKGEHWIYQWWDFEIEKRKIVFKDKYKPIRDSDLIK